VPPPGATFAATWQQGIPSSKVGTVWSGFANAVAGLFCSSLTTLAPSTMHYSPSLADEWDLFSPPSSAAEVRATLRTNGSSPTSQGQEVTFGALSQEAVCTENLTGFVKLLPCRDQAGIGKLLEPSVVFGSRFHLLELQANDRGSGTIATGWLQCRPLPLSSAMFKCN
jgi:GPI-anchor transamidase subunit T